MVLAYAVAVLHAAAVVLLLTGGLLALRWHGVLAVHLPVAVTIAAVHLAGLDCPLTDLELALRQQAGGEVYRDGFLGHYVLAPLDVDGSGASAQAALRAAALLPNAVAVPLLVGQARRRAGSTGAGRAGRRPLPARTGPRLDR